MVVKSHETANNNMIVIKRKSSQHLEHEHYDKITLIPGSLSMVKNNARNQDAMGTNSIWDERIEGNSTILRDENVTTRYVHAGSYPS